MRIHIYSQGVPTALTHAELAPDTRLGDIIQLRVEERVYKVGSEDEIDVGIALLEVFDDQPGHLIVHDCKEIAVKVSYLGEPREITVHPSTHVKKVLADAIAALGIDHGTSVDLVLRELGSSEDLDLSKPIGAYVPKDSCSIALELLHIVRPQG